MDFVAWHCCEVSMFLWFARAAACVLTIAFLRYGGAPIGALFRFGVTLANLPKPYSVVSLYLPYVNNGSFT